MMRKRYSTLTILLPILLSAMFGIGLWLGRFGLNSPQNFHSNSMQISKMDMIMDIVENEYVDSISVDSLIEKAIPELLYKLDPHSNYVGPVDFKEEMETLEGNFEGIGVQYSIYKDTMVVIRTIKGGPSAKSGLRAGDRIVMINDSNIIGLDIDNEFISKRLKGLKGTKVKVGIKRIGEKDIIQKTITRDEIPIYSVESAYMPTSEIGYIKLTKFAKNTQKEFTDAAKQLHDKGMKKLILDLRENGGGYLETAIEICDELLSEGKDIVHVVGYSRKKETYKATNKYYSCEKDELIVLIDEWSASASEILAGAVQDNDRGRIAGRRSFGKGLVQETTVFSDGSALRLTTARYYTPSGRCIQKSYKKGRKDYGMDLHNRAKHGEMYNADSIQTDDTTTYKTKSGKIVYGGGGIYPDEFIPLDTTHYTSWFKKVSRSEYIFDFCFQFTDRNREKLEPMKTHQEIITWLESQSILKQYVSFTIAKGIPNSNKESDDVKSHLKWEIYSLIVRNILDDEGYYPVIQNIDVPLQKAIDMFQNKTN